jgi:hypothetical protein
MRFATLEGCALRPLPGDLAAHYTKVRIHFEKHGKTHLQLIYGLSENIQKDLNLCSSVLICV